MTALSLLTKKLWGCRFPYVLLSFGIHVSQNPASLFCEECIVATPGQLLLLVAAVDESVYCRQLCRIQYVLPSDPIFFIHLLLYWTVVTCQKPGISLLRWAVAFLPERLHLWNQFEQS